MERFRREKSSHALAQNHGLQRVLVLQLTSLHLLSTLATHPLRLLIFACILQLTYLPERVSDLADGQHHDDPTTSGSVGPAECLRPRWRWEGGRKPRVVSRLWTTTYPAHYRLLMARSSHETTLLVEGQSWDST